LTAYRKSDAEEARMNGPGLAYCKAKGSISDRKAYCALGRQKIQKSKPGSVRTESEISIEDTPPRIIIDGKGIEVEGAMTLIQAV